MTCTTTTASETNVDGSTSIEVTSVGLRRQMARWPTGVAVVTGAGGTGPMGKTVNSFHVTSLDPPLVGWCIDHRSSQLDEWLAVPGYVVHVLAHHQHALMSHFARSMTDRFHEVGWKPGLDGMPVLTDDVPLRLDCRVTHRLPVGDHTYLIGEVVAITATDEFPMRLQR